MPISMPPATLSPADAYLGDGLSVRFDRGHVILFTQGISFVMGPSALQAFQSFVAGCTQPNGASEADVWHEGSKSHYRAILLRKLTLDEIYQGLK